jgi:hypothetical protein
MPAGRPTQFKPEYCEQVEKLCKLGATDKQLAEFFDVAVDTIYNWKHKHPEFVDAIKNGKTIADMQVSNSLFKKATGYTVEREKVVGKGETQKVVKVQIDVEPDTTAAIFWLKNRQPEYWRDRTEQNITTLTINVAFEDYIRSLNEASEAKVINGTVAAEGRRLESLPAPVRSRGSQSET